MVSIWIVIGLIVAATCVSILGAAFSVVGIAALFSGALLAVGAMAISLEFAKFVLAAYLHRRWQHLGSVYKYYLASSVVVLSVITSIGIFGFLSDAYQSASTVLVAENIKLDALKGKKSNAQNEIVRLNRTIDEIPANRITKRIQARSEIEPVIADLTKQITQIEAEMTSAELHILEVKKKVGPLIYISQTFNMDIDVVVKYLILVFVFVFDPLAICLVIATSEALEDRRRRKENPAAYASNADPVSPPPSPESKPTDGQEIIQMRFGDDSDRNVG